MLRPIHDPVDVDDETFSEALPLLLFDGETLLLFGAEEEALLLPAALLPVLLFSAVVSVFFLLAEGVRFFFLQLTVGLRVAIYVFMPLGLIEQ